MHVALDAMMQLLVCDHDGERTKRMTTHLHITATPYRQFPLRLTHDLADELDRISKRTRINKTTISRIAIQKFIAEIERTGADEVLDEVCAV